MSTRWVVAALFVLAACPAQAQETDSRWAPWLGCWRLVDERIGDLAAAGKTNPDDTLVCVERADTPAAVTLTTRIGGQPVLEQTIVANGMQRPVDEAGCRGWQNASWSRTGERLFSRAELTCAGEAGRKVSGYSTIAGGAWVDIQAINIEGREHVRVRRYRRAAGSTGRGAAPLVPGDVTAPRPGATALTIDDVKEAAEQLSPRALEAALVETSAKFDLSRRALIALDDAGVPDSVIDLMVALSYPERFVVQRTERFVVEPTSAQSPVELGSVGTVVPGSWYGGFYDTFWGSPYMPYYYAPFGYAYWAGYGVPYYAGTGFVTVEPAASGESGGGARLVNGVGYTQIRPREAEPVQGGLATGSGSTRSTSGDSSGGAGGGSSAGASPGGYSSGGSSGDSGRTAEPR